MSDETKQLRCIICEATAWKNVDEFRYVPKQMIMCESCGFVTYAKLGDDNAKENLDEFYRESYRDVPSVNHIFTGQRKLHYHAAFLQDLFREWKKAGKQSPNIGEVGAAFGMFLSWSKNVFPGAVVRGAELTNSFRKIAFHVYGLYLDEKLDESIKYDMIAAYKVAEHQPDINEQLKIYARLLNPDGVLYISIPVWFKELMNFGESGFSLESYYSTNHCNTWTRKNFEYLLNKSGFVIEKENHFYYEETYLCKYKPEIAADLKKEHDDPAFILKSLDACFRAAKAYDTGCFDEAIAIYPAFPSAHIGRYESQRKDAHAAGYEAIVAKYINPMLDALPDAAVAWLHAGDVAMRYDQWVEAVKYFDKNLSLRPNSVEGLTALGHCFRQMSERAETVDLKTKWLKEAIEVGKFHKSISLQTQFDATSWIFQDCSKLELPSREDAMKSAKNDIRWNAPPIMQSV